MEQILFYYIYVTVLANHVKMKSRIFITSILLFFQIYAFFADKLTKWGKHIRQYWVHIFGKS